MSDAVSTTGMLVRRSPFPAATPAVYTTVPELVTITPPGYSRNKIETSTHNDGSESFVLGIIRQGDLTFRVNWLPENAEHAQILADFNANTKAVWQIAFPSGATFTAPGRVSRFAPVDAPPDAAQQLEITIAWAGPIVFDDGVA
jgi:hypothetical protein